MVTLNGVALGTLDSDVVWTDRYASAGIEQLVKRTLGGLAVVLTGQLQGGLPITLQGLSDQGWLTKAQADALLAMAATPGAVYTLDFGGSQLQVMFDHTSGPAVSLTPQVYRTTQLTADYFTGQIKLLTA
jgi:hypothetical protein